MPAYGIQLHDPQLLEYLGVPESARLRRRPHTLQRAVAAEIRHCPQQDVVGGHADRIRSEAVSGGCYATSGAVVPGSSGGTLHGSYGLVVATSYSGNSGTPAVGDMQCLHVVQ